MDLSLQIIEDFLKMQEEFYELSLYQKNLYFEILKNIEKLRKELNYE